MEYYSRKSLYNFMNEEKKAIQIQSPPLLTKPCGSSEHDHHLNISPSRNSSSQTKTMYSLMPPPSPDSPWTLSPLQTPKTTVLYHCIASLRRQEGLIHSIALSKGIIYTGSESRRIRAWRQPECHERGYIKASCGEVRAILAYENRVFTSHKDHKVRVWRVTTSENFKAKKVITLSRKSRSSLLFLFNKASPHHHHQNQQHKSVVSCMAYYHAEGLLYTGSWDRTIKVWRVSDSARCVDSFLAHEDNVNSIVINQEDGCVFSCSSDGSLKIWRRVYGQGSHTLTITLKFQPSPINALALSASQGSCFLYSGSSDGFINFWEKEKMSTRYNHGGFLQGHRFAVLCLVAIEKLIFSGSEDTTIRVWRRSEEGSYYHECLAVVEAHRGPVKCLAASLEMENINMVMGLFLVYSAGLDHSFKVWRIKIMPEEKNVISIEGIDGNNNNVKSIAEYEMSPVLSPSWVERKRKGNQN